MKNPFSLNFLFKKKSSSEEEKEIFYPVCPKCISPKLNVLREFTSGWLTSPRYVCSNCNYTGQIILEIDVKMLEEYSTEELKKMYIEDLETENFEDP